MQLGTIWFFDLFPLLHLLCLDQWTKRVTRGKSWETPTPWIPLVQDGTSTCAAKALTRLKGQPGVVSQSTLTSLLRSLHIHISPYTSSIYVTSMRFFLAAFRRATSFKQKFSTCETLGNKQCKTYNHTFNKY